MEEIKERIAPPLPVKENDVKGISIDLNNRLLTEEEINKINSINGNYRIIISFYSSIDDLKKLFEQISYINKKIQLNLHSIFTNEDINIDVNTIPNNIKFLVTNSPDETANFYSYLINLSEEDFRKIQNQFDEEVINIIKMERDISRIMVARIEEELNEQGKSLNDMSNDEKMNCIFNYVNINYPYDHSIPNEDGSYNAECGNFRRGYQVFNQKRGICSGRSELLKLATNNQYLHLPCYLASGYYGPLEHEWNEYVSESGEIMLYDLSIGINNLFEANQYTDETVDIQGRKRKPYFKMEHEQIVEKKLVDLSKRIANPKRNSKAIEAYKKVIENAGFDINAGQNIDSSKTILDLSKEAIELLSNKGKGCCFHASMFLGSLLHEMGIECEMILTPEKAINPDGTERTDNRASILVKDNGEYYVMNPVEDIEFFEENNITENRMNYYAEGSTLLKGAKRGITSRDAGCMKLDEFVEKYGNGSCWTFGNIFANGNQTLNNCFANVKKLNISDYIKNSAIKK